LLSSARHGAGHDTNYIQSSARILLASGGNQRTLFTHHHPVSDEVSFSLSCVFLQSTPSAISLFLSLDKHANTRDLAFRHTTTRRSFRRDTPTKRTRDSERVPPPPLILRLACLICFRSSYVRPSQGQSQGSEFPSPPRIKSSTVAAFLLIRGFASVPAPLDHLRCLQPVLRLQRYNGSQSRLGDPRRRWCGKRQCHHSRAPSPLLLNFPECHYFKDHTTQHARNRRRKKATRREGGERGAQTCGGG